MNDLWQGFCRRMSVIDQSVPLFDSDTDGIVQIRNIGHTNPRPVLKRSERMEELVLVETDKLLADAYFNAEIIFEVKSYFGFI